MVSVLRVFVRLWGVSPWALEADRLVVCTKSSWSPPMVFGSTAWFGEGRPWRDPLQNEA